MWVDGEMVNRRDGNSQDSARSTVAPRRVALGVTLALLLAACGSSSNEASGSASSSASPTEAATDESQSPGAAAELPGSEEFGLTMEELALRVEQVEAAIGTCMSVAGFEYVPVDFDTIRDAQSADGTLPGVSDDDFLAQYGFGLTTLADRPNMMVTIAQGQNGAIFEALGEADQIAYTRTLLGENDDAAFVVGLEEEDFSDTGGCTRSAVAEFFTDDELTGNYVNPGDALIDNDPRMVAAFGEWSDCLADDGFDYDHPDDLDDDLVDQLDAILGDQEAGELTGESLQALNELQGFERAIAEIAEDCEDDHIAPVEEEIETELYGAPQG